ncbi:MAG: glycosyltransferase family 39 protein [Planctomycetota bacterium]|nr:glycosyltransferase family 39 protein [Planctomycetota bacterium]
MGRSPAEAPPGVCADRFARGLLAAALVLGLLRFLRLSEWSLWIDESLTWADAHHGIEGGEIRNPLGYRLIAWTVDLLGGTPSEFSLRILPAVAGWLCIPATFCAFRGLFGERRAAVASLLVAVSSWHLYWSQNARFYTLSQLALLLGAWTLFAALARGRSVVAVLGIAIAAGGALFHPSAVLLLPALALAPLLLERLGRGVAPAVGRAPRVLALVALLGGVLGIGWILKTWDTYAYQKGQESTLAAAGASIAHFAKTTGFFVTPLLATAVLCGGWFAWRSRRGPEAFAVLVVASTLLFALVASALVRVSAQYVFVVLPWIALVAALPVGNGLAGPFGRRGEMAWILVLALPALATCGLYMTVRRGERPPWREAYDHVANARGPGDQIFGMEASVGEFYLAPGNTDLRRPTALTWLDYFHARIPEHWAAKGRRAWYVVNPEQFAGWDPRDAAEFQRFLRDECRLDAVWPLYVESRDLSVWVYRRD